MREPSSARTAPHTPPAPCLATPGSQALSTSCRAVCERHPALAALFESETGQIALLLTHTVLPLTCERDAWLHETRQVAGEVIADLRGAGVRNPCLVLQWQPLSQIASVLDTWACRWDGRPERRGVLARIAREQATDAAFLAQCREVGRAEVETDKTLDAGVNDDHAESPLDWPALLEWYRSMAPTWLAVHPPLRRHLLLVTHLWVIRYVLAPWTRASRIAAADLPDRSGLAPRLMRSAGPRHRHAWLPWIDVVVATLEDALTWPPDKRTEDWVKWLFLIPYGVPVPARARLAVAPGASGDLEAIHDLPLGVTSAEPSTDRPRVLRPTRRTTIVDGRA